MDIIQLDCNVACMHRCSNCTRGVAHQKEKWEMSPEAAKEAIASMQGWYKPGNVLGLIGGEVTLHSRFPEIAAVFRENWNPQKKVWLGGQPIADFNAFANQRLFDRISGRGLWTSLGTGFYRNMEHIFSTFDHWNTNTHEAGGLHQALFITREEYQAATGMGNAEWEANRDRCWVQNMWSATINDKGGYPCEVMGTIDRLYFNGAHAWPVEKGWWKRQPKDFGSMLELCNFCSLAQPGLASVDAKERDTLSQISVDRLKAAGSPAVAKGRFDVYEQTQERKIETKDSYMQGDLRVGEKGEASVRPKKLSAVVVCVGYADKLKHTLPTNMGLTCKPEGGIRTYPQVDEMIVVTTSEDIQTRQICHNFGVRVVISNSCYDDNASFNKGKLQNVGLASLTNPDWVVFCDADVFLNPRLLEYVKSHTFNPGCIYGAPRHHIEESEASKIMESHPMDRPEGIDNEPNGFFTLFNPRAQSLQGRPLDKLMSEAFCSAGGIDSWFMQQFPPDKRIMLPEIPVVHIAHGEFGDNWNGLQPSSGPRWRQLGMITAQGWKRLYKDLPDFDTVRLTDTLHGKQVTLKMKPREGFPEDVIRLTHQGIVFCGLEIGHNHVHVAYLESSSKEKE